MHLIHVRQQLLYSSFSAFFNIVFKAAFVVLANYIAEDIDNLVCSLRQGVGWYAVRKES